MSKNFGMMNLCLMWLEFFMATKRLANVSSGLKFTRYILVIIMTIVALLCVPTMTLAAIDFFGFWDYCGPLWSAAQMADATINCLFFSVGAKKISNIYLRAARSAAAKGTSTGT